MIRCPGDERDEDESAVTPHPQYSADEYVVKIHRDRSPRQLNEIRKMTSRSDAPPNTQQQYLIRIIPPHRLIMVR